jgi:class 3 adenylate cyclase
LIVGFLREFFNEADKIINKNNWILDKFIGDGIIAIFGFKDSDILDYYEVLK